MRWASNTCIMNIPADIPGRCGGKTCMNLRRCCLGNRFREAQIDALKYAVQVSDTTGDDHCVAVGKQIIHQSTLRVFE